MRESILVAIANVGEPIFRPMEVDHVSGEHNVETPSSFKMQHQVESWLSLESRCCGRVDA